VSLTLTTEALTTRSCWYPTGQWRATSGSTNNLKRTFVASSRWAMSKVGPAFTHVSYDDSRILRHYNLLEHGSATTRDRLSPIPIFIDLPQFGGALGMNENEARKQGRNIRSLAKLPHECRDSLHSKLVKRRRLHEGGRRCADTTDAYPWLRPFSAWRDGEIMAIIPRWR